MNKDFGIKIIVVAGILILFFTIFNRCSKIFVDSTNYKTDSIVTQTTKSTLYEYSLDEAPEKYGVRTSKENRSKYFEYLKQYIKPVKLLNHISESDLESDLYDDPGNKTINWLVAMAYINMIKSMFDINRTNFKDCAVTNNFLEKFDKNLSEYFDIVGEDSTIEVYTTDKIIKYNKWWNLGPDGDPANGHLYVFKYTLDENGNVDDIVLDDTTGDL